MTHAASNGRSLFGTSSETSVFICKTSLPMKNLAGRQPTEQSSVVQTEGRRRVTRSLVHYNLDAILSVGYRVSSRRGTPRTLRAERYSGGQFPKPALPQMRPRLLHLPRPRHKHHRSIPTAREQYTIHILP